MTGVYVRWKVGEERLVSKMPPLAVDHPLAGQPCLVCGINLFGGIDTPRDIALLALGAEPDDREKAAAARWFTAVALPLHATCVDPTHVEGSAQRSGS
jgi:hypothetical protein